MRLVQITESVWVNPAHIEAVGINERMVEEGGSDRTVYVNMASDVGYSVEALEGETVEQTLARIVQLIAPIGAA